MYSVRNVNGHYHVFDSRGIFLFSADTEGEIREELREYEEYSA